MKRFRLTKLTDDKFEGKHPNGFYEGYVEEGYIMGYPVVGQGFYIGSLQTSTVTEVIDSNTFKTLNSTYKLEELEDDGMQILIKDHEVSKSKRI